MLGSVCTLLLLFVVMPITLTLTEPASFQLYYDPSIELIRGRWPDPVLDADLRGHYIELLAQAQQHNGCCYWLLDMRRRHWHMPSFGPWFSTEYAAAVQEALGRPVFIAYVLSPRHEASAESLRTQATQCTCTQHDIYPCFFATEEAALDWLHHQQALH
jgi:hypothetical protein